MLQSVFEVKSSSKNIFRFHIKVALQIQSILDY